MSIRSVDAIERSVHKTNRWMSELAEELRTDDREATWRALRAYLQVLRDQLTTSEAAQLGAQLPLVVRGAFYEGFDPDRQPQRLRDREAFLARLAELGQLDGRGQAAHVATSATAVLSRHVSGGEVQDVLAQLPAELREGLDAG
jgi:uncharacterized protein (DUF2267 family)